MHIEGPKIYQINRQKKFQQEFFSGLVPTQSLRIQDSENIVGLGDQASVSKL